MQRALDQPFRPLRNRFSPDNKPAVDVQYPNFQCLVSRQGEGKTDRRGKVGMPEDRLLELDRDDARSLAGSSRLPAFRTRIPRFSTINCSSNARCCYGTPVMASQSPLTRSPEHVKKPHPEPNVLHVVLGNLLIRPWYPSFYPEDLVGSRTERLYVCQWCFRYSRELMPYLAHMVCSPIVLTDK